MTPIRAIERSWETDSRTLCGAAALALVLATVLWVGPTVLRVDIFEDDATQHVWWLYQYADPSLFSGDVAVEYFRTMAPLGYRALYAIVAPMIDALLAAKLLSAVLYLAGGWIAWKIGMALEGSNRELRGFLAVVAFIVVVSISRVTATGVLPAMAFQRTFSLPLVLLCLWALVARRYAWVGISWIASALFYPVLLPLMGLSAAFVFLHDLLSERRLPDAWWLNGIFGVAALALALFGVPKADELGPAFTYEQAAVMPEFGPGGRLQMYVPGLFANLVRFHMTGLGTSPYLLLLLGAAVALVWWRGRRALIPAPAWIMLGVGVALWALLRLFPATLMFGLYVPNRHSRWAIAAFAIVAFTAAACVILEWVIEAAHEMRWPAAVVRSLGRALVVTLAIVSVGLLWPYAHAQLTQPVDRDLERVYEFIGGLPADTLVAAHPTLADNIPLRTRRSVLTSTETSMPWLAGYYRIVKPRVEASLRAAYAVDASEVDSELAPYGVDIFVTGPPVWRETSYHEPYDRELVQGLLKRGRASGFALRDPPANRVLFRSGEYYVLRVGAFEPPTEGSAR